MEPNPQENSKAIRFAGELLPDWARLLDVAARMCPLSDGDRHWFRQLTMHDGVDDAGMVIGRCTRLRRSVVGNRDGILVALRRDRDDAQPDRIVDAWIYALDTIIEAAQSADTCSWRVEGADEEDPGCDGFGGGDVTIRRV